MGYAWSGVCYQDMASAYEAFRIGLTNFGDVQITMLESSSITETGLITWTARVTPFGGNQIPYTKTSTVQLVSCNPVRMDQWPVQSVIFFIALAFAAFIGFRTGFRP